MPSYNWNVNNQNINRAGVALGALLAKALGSDLKSEEPKVNEKRTAKELKEATTGTGYFTTDPSEFTVKSDPKSKEFKDDMAKTKSMVKQGERMKNPESARALSSLLNKKDQSDLSKATTTALIDDPMDKAVVSNLAKMEKAKLAKEKQLQGQWELQDDREFENLEMFNKVTGERKPLLDELGQPRPNKRYTDVVARRSGKGNLYEVLRNGKTRTIPLYEDKDETKLSNPTIRGLETTIKGLNTDAELYNNLQVPEKPQIPLDDSGQPNEYDMEYKKQKIAYDKFAAEKAKRLKTYQKTRTAAKEHALLTLKPNDRDKLTDITDKIMKEPDLLENKQAAFYEVIEEMYGEFESPATMEVALKIWSQVHFGVPYHKSPQYKELMNSIGRDRGSE